MKSCSSLVVQQGSKFLSVFDLDFLYISGDSVIVFYRAQKGPGGSTWLMGCTAPPEIADKIY